MRAFFLGPPLLCSRQRFDLLGAGMCLSSRTANPSLLSARLIRPLTAECDAGDRVRASVAYQPFPKPRAKTTARGFSFFHAQLPIDGNPK
jgi:hypothetical protein